MKSKNIELDVDFIGGQGPLTKAEEIAISNYIKAQREKKTIPKINPKLRGKGSSHKKVVALA